MMEKWGFTAKEAKRLTERPGRPYKMLEDRNGDEWLVGPVLDGGRLMRLWKAGTGGKVVKDITSREYCDYRVILGEEDIEAVGTKQESEN